MKRWCAHLAIFFGVTFLGQLTFVVELCAQGTEWLEIDPRVRRILSDYYTSSGSVRGGPPPDGCRADEGDFCFGGDPEDQFCFLIPACRTEEEVNDFLQRLRVAAEENPRNACAMGQAVYAFARLGRFIEAFQLAEACQAEQWWCDLLLGLVLHRSGQPSRAEAKFRLALEQADPELTCRLKDVGPLLSWGDRRRYQREACSSRDSLDARFWWVADPFFSMVGNDRWTEHIARRLELVLHEQIVEEALGSGHPATHEQTVVMRGPEDSWGEQVYRRWASQRAAAFHFVPERGSRSAELSELVYRLDASDSDEGFTPIYAPVASLPVQVARFRQGDSMLVAVAGTLSGSPLSTAPDPAAYLILSDGPNSFPHQLASSFSNEKAVFLGQMPPERFVISHEVLSQEGVGRHRVVLDPLDMEGSGISDLLLFSPLGQFEPDSLLVAVGMMLGDTRVGHGRMLGVYWETYGHQVDGPVRIELEVRRVGGGLVEAIRRIFPGGGEGGTRRLSWTVPKLGGDVTRAVVLDLEALEPGAYSLLLRTWWAGQEQLEAERTFEVR